jgi:hypothetical protein
VELRCNSYCQGLIPDSTVTSLFLFFSLLGLELRAFILSYSTSSIFVKGVLRYGLVNYLSRLASNHDPPDLCLLSN